MKFNKKHQIFAAKLRLFGSETNINECIAFSLINFAFSILKITVGVYFVYVLWYFFLEMRN